jgi:hypothetical protein
LQTGAKLPEAIFHTRIRHEAIGGANPLRWEDLKHQTISLASASFCSRLPVHSCRFARHSNY